jgi:adenosine deaminase
MNRTASPYRTLPKIELHLHLDCSLSYAVVAALDPSVTLDAYARDYVAPAKCIDLPDYLARTTNSVNLLQSERALWLATADLFARLAADGVIYAEIRFAPLLHLAGGLAAPQVVEIVSDAVDQAVAQTGVEARLILCTLRHFTPAQSRQTADLVTRYRDGRVAAIDIASDEAGYPLDAHVEAFARVAAHDIPATAHAGEGAGPASVWETLDRLRPARLGHGVRSIEDPVLMGHLGASGIHLEVCPTCNVQIGLYDTLADHPIDRLVRAGLSVGVNTDTRGVTATTLSDDYARLAETFGWTRNDFLRANLAAAAAAFAPDDVKAGLARRLKAGYGKDLE